MLTFLLLAVLAVLLFFVVKALFKKDTPPPAKPVEDLANLRITQARVGDNVSVSGAGENFGDVDFTIDHRHRYESGGDVWYEYTGLYRNRRVYLDVFETDTTEVYGVLDGRNFEIREIGLTEEELGQMDEEQNPANYFEFEGKKWYYLLSREVGYFEDGQGEGEGFYNWEYKEDGNTGRFLSIQKWEGRPFEAQISRLINADTITIYRS